MFTNLWSKFCRWDLDILGIASYQKTAYNFVKLDNQIQSNILTSPGATNELGRLQRSLLLSHRATAWISCYQKIWRVISTSLTFTVEPLNDATREKVQDNWVPTRRWSRIRNELGRLQRSLLLSHCETAWIGCYLQSKNLKGHFN